MFRCQSVGMQLGCIVLLFALQCASASSAAAGLIDYWRLDRPDSGSTLTNAVANEPHLVWTKKGAPTSDDKDYVTGFDGKTDGAVYMNATFERTHVYYLKGSYDTSNYVGAHALTNYTLSFWVRLYQKWKFASLFSIQAGDDTDVTLNLLNDNGGHYELEHDTTHSLDLIDDTEVKGALHHVALRYVYDANASTGSVHCYVDGSLVSEQALNVLPAFYQSGAFFAGYSEKSDYSTRAVFDDIGLYDEALDDARVKAIHSAGTYDESATGGLDLRYDLGEVQALFDLFDAGSGTVVVGDQKWTCRTDLDGELGVVTDGGGRGPSLVSIRLDDSGNGVHIRRIPPGTVILVR